jgi:hypothetical protein
MSVPPTWWCRLISQVVLAASQALAHHTDVAYKAIPPLVSHLTPSRRKAFVPKFLSILIESFRFGRRCYFAFGFCTSADFYERTA